MPLGQVPMQSNSVLIRGNWDRERHQGCECTEDKRQRTQQEGATHKLHEGFRRKQPDGKKKERKQPEDTLNLWSLEPSEIKVCFLSHPDCRVLLCQLRQTKIAILKKKKKLERSHFLILNL